MMSFAVFLDKEEGVKAFRQYIEMKLQHRALRTVAMAAQASFLSIHEGLRPAQQTPRQEFHTTQPYDSAASKGA